MCFVNAMEQVNAMTRIENLQKSFDTALRLYLMLNVVPIHIVDKETDDTAYTTTATTTDDDKDDKKDYDDGTTCS